MSGADKNPVLGAFLENLAEAWTQLLNGVHSGSCTVQIQEEAEAHFGEAAVRLVLKLEGALSGSAVLEMSEADSSVLTAQLAQRSADGAQVPGQSVSVAGLLSQTIALAAKKTRATHGKTLVTVSSGDAPVWRPSHALSLITDAPNCAAFAVRILLSEAIVAPSPSAMPAEAPVQNTSPAREALQQANLDRILEVALELKIQFGRRVLPLVDLVELAAGSVIELDKRAQEPASLLLGGKVIARGEVVLSEGNYALRVTEICDVRQRLESV